MENRKCVMLDEVLHRRLKSFCATHNMLMSNYIDYCVGVLLLADELGNNKEYNRVEEEIFAELEKKYTTNDFNEEHFNQLVSRKNKIIEDTENGI
jgi:hypothetical protein